MQVERQIPGTDGLLPFSHMQKQSGMLSVVQPQTNTPCTLILVQLRHDVFLLPADPLRVGSLLKLSK